MLRCDFAVDPRSPLLLLYCGLGDTYLRHSHTKQGVAGFTLVKINEKSIIDLVELPIDELLEFMSNLKLHHYQKNLAKRIIKEINNNLLNKEFTLGDTDSFITIK